MADETHFAEKLEAGDRIFASFKNEAHKSHNRHNVPCIVIKCSRSKHVVKAYDTETKEQIFIPFSDIYENKIELYNLCYVDNFTLCGACQSVCLKK